jgi:hypothetical protein
MKPSFALNLTEEGVTLLHRTARGWLDVGQVAFDDDDLPAALDYLRSTALGLSPKDITTKLVIPNSQILYLEVTAPGPDKASKEAQIAAALEGRTPYAVSELAYDWSGEGSAVMVAVVAKDTLAEAEAFATEHRFNPLSFCAIPPDGFAREPFFGTSKVSATLLSKGKKVEPDSDPIVIITREMPKADTTTERPAPADVVDEVVQPDPHAATVAEVTPETPQDLSELVVPPTNATDVAKPSGPVVETEVAPEAVPPLVPPKSEAPELPVADPLPETASSAAIDTPEAAKPPAPDFVAQSGFAPPTRAEEPAFSEPDPLPAAAVAVPDPAPIEAQVKQSDRVIAPDTDEAPLAVDVPVEEPPPARKPSVLTAELDDIPPAPAAATMMAFASRRAAEAEQSGKKGDPASRVVPLPSLGGATSSSTVPRPAMAKPITERPTPVARPTPKFSYDDPVPPPPRLPGDPPAASVGVMGKAGKGLRSLSTLVSAPDMSGVRKKNPPPTPAQAAAVSPAATAATLTATNPKVTRLADVERPAGKAKPKLVEPDALARGLGARGVQQRGKPRFLGLIMTGILLLMLAIVAAWSSFFLTQNDPQVLDDTTVASATLDATSATDDIPAPNDEMLADLEDQSDLGPDVVAPEAVDTALIAAPEAVEPALPPAEAVAAEEPAVEVVEAVAPEPTPEPAPGPAPQTGVEPQVAEAAQPNVDGQDEIFLAGMDAPPSFSDPLVLTAPAAVGDVLPGPQMPPPPFGTVYQFDENGMILPTAEGITTPEGVLLIAGKPPLVPPPRPASVLAAANAVEPQPEAAVAAAVATTPAAETAVTPEQTFAADPALSTARPRVRPAGLAPAAPAGGEDDASLAPAEGSRFASLRPRLRPQAILAAGESARRESEAASLALQAAATAAAQAVVADQAQLASLSPTAVTVSRVPAPRPRDMSKAVAVAVAAATQQSAPRQTEQANSEPAHEEADSEPEVVASAAPRIPTRANVAQQATFVNAINLSKTNLIGVYGSQSKRYALVRQSNGRYKKVKVGDTVDGGKVQAITSNEVRYQKGGRLLSLTMPKT